MSLLLATSCLLALNFDQEILAFRAYSEPKPEAISIPSLGDVPGWNDGKQHLVWFVKFRQIGEINVTAIIKNTDHSKGRLRLVCHDSDGKLLSAERDAAADNVPFGKFTVRHAGYVKFELNPSKPMTNWAVHALKLSGAPMTDALINQTQWRSSASVHLRWPTEKAAKVEWFYNEILPKTSPLATYYMSCGWSRGYFGIQVNSPTERRVIFSVWDSGAEKVSRDKVDPKLQVQLMGKGDGVFTGSFGNEGTGGHSHLVYDWKTGEVQRFLVRSEPNGTTTTYSGYYYFRDQKRWGLISSWRAPQDGGYLHNLYSFIEDFWGGEGQKQRLADFGPAWVRVGGKWIQVVNGSFTHTARMPNYREDYFCKVNGIRVTASAGGYTNDGPTAYGAKFDGVKPSKPLSADALEFIAATEGHGH